MPRSENSFREKRKQGSSGTPNWRSAADAHTANHNRAQCRWDRGWTSRRPRQPLTDDVTCVSITSHRTTSAVANYRCSRHANVNPTLPELRSACFSRSRTSPPCPSFHPSILPMKRVRKLLTRLYPRLNTVPKPLIVTLLILFALVALRTLSLPPSPTSFSFPRNPFPDRSPNETVSVWYHPRCRGAFTTSAAPDAHNGFPYAAVRDATVDRRPATKTELGYHDPPGVQRIMLFVSCHLSARLTREGAFVTVEGSDVLAAVEYVIHANKFLTRGKYAPGKRTIFGREVTEWHVGIRLQPAPSALESAVHDAFRHDRQINISLPVIRYDEKIIPMFVNMNAACVMGVRTPGVHRAEECATDHRTATGAVLFSGSSLYGTKKRSKQHFREVANFAARALLGPIRYHTVVMSVVTDFSQSDADYRCAASESCRLRLDLDNHKHLTSIAQTVMDELDAIGVPRALFSRLIILPSCRLGSDPWKSEREDPCRSSKRYGQYYATFFSYAILAPYFKVCLHPLPNPL